MWGNYQHSSRYSSSHFYSGWYFTKQESCCSLITVLAGRWAPMLLKMTAVKQPGQLVKPKPSAVHFTVKHHWITQTYYTQQQLSVHYLSRWVFICTAFPNHSSSSYKQELALWQMCFILTLFFWNQWWLQITNTCDEQKANTVWNQGFWCSTAKAQHGGSSVL